MTKEFDCTSFVMEFLGHFAIDDSMLCVKDPASYNGDTTSMIKNAIRSLRLFKKIFVI